MTTRLHHRSKRQLRRRLGSVLVLRVIWTVTIIWAEWLYFDLSISGCRWPLEPSGSNSKADPSTGKPFHVLILADPQLPSMEYSYPTRIYPLRWLSIKIIDQFIRKSWRLVIRNTQPDAIVFLGDLLDGGIAAVDPITFRSYVNRFYHTFAIPSGLLPPLSANQSNDSPRLIHLVGNHDVGLYPSTSTINSTLARQRFTKHWSPGKLNGKVEWGNHTMIWLDALSVIEEAKRKASGMTDETEGEVTQFLKGLSGPEMLLPKVLFTHVPLWRPEGTSCGPLRESRREIHQGAGINYQNEIPEAATKIILERVQPDLIFSGDDHDYCEVVHTISSTSLANPSPLSIGEISVKSFSMGMGVKNPGYHLLTLFNPARFGKAPDEKTTFHKPCFLPDQIWIYTHIYLPLFILSIAVFFGPPVWKYVKKTTATTRQQAKTNGLPIHRSQRHRKSLSRTLMFTKPSSGSLSSSSSSAEDARSDEEASSARFVTHRPRRSTSLGLGIGLGIGLGLEGGEGFNPSSAGMLSYHSPVDSGHDDERFSQPSPALGLDMSKMRRSIDVTGGTIGGSDFNSYPPPSHHYGRSLSSRFQSNDPISSRTHQQPEQLMLRLVRLLIGRKLGESLKRWLMKRGIISASPGYPQQRRPSRSFNENIRRNNLSSILNLCCIKLFQLLWVILVVYFLFSKFKMV